MLLSVSEREREGGGEVCIGGLNANGKECNLEFVLVKPINIS